MENSNSEHATDHSCECTKEHDDLSMARLFFRPTYSGTHQEPDCGAHYDPDSDADPVLHKMTWRVCVGRFGEGSRQKGIGTASLEPPQERWAPRVFGPLATLDIGRLLLARGPAFRWLVLVGVAHNRG